MACGTQHVLTHSTNTINANNILFVTKTKGHIFLIILCLLLFYDGAPAKFPRASRRWPGTRCFISSNAHSVSGSSPPANWINNIAKIKHQMHRVNGILYRKIWYYLVRSVSEPDSLEKQRFLSRLSIHVTSWF